ncbi:palmitoyltransferase pfa5 [Bachmanniomyces sp. S44760]|nr:palmitoyltransferase pfa5 [Bachmanniomyces sp. S44760]
MSGSSLQFAFINSTTVENLSRKIKVWDLAVYMPNPPAPNAVLPFQTITYPLITSSDTYGNGYYTNPISPPPVPSSTSQTQTRTATQTPRTFAILHTKPGENPWDLGSPFANLCTVMGDNPFDWIFPLHHSPCTNHNRGESAFALGPVVQRLKQEAGIVIPNGSSSFNGEEEKEKK